MAKELFTRRYEEDLIEALKKAAKKEGITHTQFIERAIDEKLVRDGHQEDSLLLNEIDKT